MDCLSIKCHCRHLPHHADYYIPNYKQGMGRRERWEVASQLQQLLSAAAAATVDSCSVLCASHQLLAETLAILPAITGELPSELAPFWQLVHRSSETIAFCYLFTITVDIKH